MKVIYVGIAICMFFCVAISKPTLVNPPQPPTETANPEVCSYNSSFAHNYYSIRVVVCMHMYCIIMCCITLSYMQW